MPLQDTDYELIDKHLLGRLDQAAKKIFAQRKGDKDFQKELAWRKDMQLVFKKKGRQDLKSRLQALEQENAAPSIPAVKEAPNFLTVISKKWMSIAALFMLVTIGMWLWNTQTPTPDQLFAQHYEPYPNIVAPIVKSETSTKDYDLAFQLYEQQQYAEALQLFQQLPQDETTEFYQALSFLGQHDFEKAIDQLVPITQNVDARFYQPVQWYLALTYLHAHQKEAAQALLMQIAMTNPHLFQSKAKQILTQL